MPRDSNSPTAAPMLRARGVAKSFGRTQALTEANLVLRQGEVHALLGANGAGKSTLSRVISGHIQPDDGELLLRGEVSGIRSTRDALDAGVVLVAQETSLAPDMSVLENIFLPELGEPGRLSFRGMRDRARRILGSLGHDHSLPLDAEVRGLSSAQRQLVEIAKALALESDLIIFDEPTASLSPGEVERLFDVITRLRDDGKALAFVSHRLEEVFAITDRVTVLREGGTVAEDVETGSLTQSDIIRHMVGKEIGEVHGRRDRSAGAGDAPAVFSVRGLRSAPQVRDISFDVRPGEILGLGGLVGAGRSEAAEAIFGLRRREAGAIRLEGRDLVIRKPADAIRAGIGMMAEDRRAQNIVPDLNVRENLFLAQTGRHRGIGRGYGPRRDAAARLLERLDLPADRLDASLLNFSGGMQQKIILARWLLIEPRVLILDEPTKGVDIGTRAAIYEILRDVADSGVAVVVISSDFEELLGLCERITVISDGQSIADLPAKTLTEESLTLLAAPRSSAERNAAFLAELTERYGGAAFWALIDGETVICLAEVTRDPGCALGLDAGGAGRATDTTIPDALGRRTEVAGFATETGGGRKALVRQLANRRGHDMGWIGLILPADVPEPDPAEIDRRITALTHPEAEETAP